MDMEKENPQIVDLSDPNKFVIYGFASFGVTTILWLLCAITGVLFKVTLVLGTTAVAYGAYKHLKNHFAKKDTR